MNSVTSAKFACPHCQATIRYKPEFSGRKAKCPSCSHVIEIPGQAPNPLLAANASATATPPMHTASATLTVASFPAEQPTDVQTQSLRAFKGSIQPIETSSLYRVAIALTAGAMLLLTTTYLAIIVGVTWLVYYHAVNDVAVFKSMGSGRGSAKAALFLYAAPLMAGVVMVFFLVKPLFARRVVVDKPRSLRRQDEPFLFAFVDRVCQVVGAPAPSWIDVDCQVNASAGFRRGILSMFNNELVLTIGLPLVAGLNLQQFAGVLAHEFGHFSQGAGTRLSYLVRSISGWFARLVYERDAWDARLQAWKHTDHRLAVFAYFAILCVWATRRVLWCLMMLGYLVSTNLLRHMEFNADLHEIRLSGSSTFAATSRQLQIIGLATRGAYNDLHEFYKEGRLADNLPVLIQAKIGQIPAEVSKAIAEANAAGTTGVFDTHPCDRERVAAATRENTEGVFHSSFAAASLFINFNALAKTCTWDFYRGIFGDQFKLTDMHPVDSLIERQDADEKMYKALFRYFQDSFSVLQPIALPSTWVEVPEDAKATLALVKRLRSELVAAVPKLKPLAEQFGIADDRVVQLNQAQALLKARLKFKPETLKLPSTTPAVVQEAHRSALEEIVRLTPAVERLADHNGRRLYAAMQLLQVPQVASRLGEADKWQVEVNDLLQVAGLMGRQIGTLKELRNEYASFSLLLSQLDANRENQALAETLLATMKRVWQLTANLRESLTQASYPFDHTKGPMKLEEFVLAEMPAANDLGAIYEAGGRVLDRIPALYSKVVARLAAIGEQIEQTVGLPPLDEPVKKESEPTASAV